jgi:hypothetical protein
MVSVADTFMQGDNTVGRFIWSDRGDAQDDPHCESDPKARGARGDAYGRNGAGHRQRLRKPGTAGPLPVALAGNQRHIASLAPERLWTYPQPAGPARVFSREEEKAIPRVAAVDPRLRAMRI